MDHGEAMQGFFDGEAALAQLGVVSALDMTTEVVNPLTLHPTPQILRPRLFNP